MLQMLRFSILRSAPQSVHRLWREASIPFHTPEDALAMLVFSDPKILPLQQLQDLLTHMRRKTMGLSSLGAFQVLTALTALQDRVELPRDLLEDLAECVRFSRPVHSPQIYIRSLECLAQLMGGFWDPLVFLHSSPLLLDDCQAEDIVRLAQLRLGPLEGLRKRVGSLASVLSPLQESKLAFLLREPSLLPSPNKSVNPGIISFAIQCLASSSSTEDSIFSSWNTEMRKALNVLSPKEAQASLLSMLALREDAKSDLIRRLTEVANQGPWESVQARHVCHALTREELESLSCKIPQLAVNRKVEALERLRKYIDKKPWTVTRNPSCGSLLLDLNVNDRPVLVRTIPWDPVFGIYQKLLPENTLVIDSEVASDDGELDRLFSL